MTDTRGKSIAFVAVAAACALVLLSAPRPCGAVDQWTVGVGLGLVPDYEGSNDYELLPVGTFRAAWNSGRFVDLAGTHGSGKAARFRFNLLTGGDLVAGPVLQLRRSRGDVSHNSVHRMPRVDSAAEAGGFVGYNFDNFGLQATAATEVSQAAKSGTTVELAARYQDRPSRNLGWGMSLSSTWASDDYMQTYFGVNATQSAQSGLSTYNADSGFKDVTVGVHLDWAGDNWGGWSIRTMASYARLIGDADDSSPIVDVGSENQLFGGLVLLWSS